MQQFNIVLYEALENIPLESLRDNQETHPAVPHLSNLFTLSISPLYYGRLYPSPWTKSALHHLFFPFFWGAFSFYPTTLFYALCSLSAGMARSYCSLNSIFHLFGIMKLICLIIIFDFEHSVLCITSVVEFLELLFSCQFVEEEEECLFEV